jgi:AbrB family looped-hinge helix DNA binding protein
VTKPTLLLLATLKENLHWTGKELRVKVRNRETSSVKKQARITSKGQITVPHEVRRALGVRPGDKLLFEQDGAAFRVRPVRKQSPFEKYRGVGNPGIPSGRKAIVRYFRKMRGK